MSRRIHGLISLFLFDAACWVGVIAAFLDSALAGLICIAAITGGAVLLITSFCAKCVCTGETCAHLLPGKAVEILTRRADGPYQSHELFAALISGLLIIATPQVWLASSPVWLAAYWVLVITAVIEIRLFVSPGCPHHCCPVNPWKQHSTDVRER